MHSTNYSDTFISVADDCPAAAGTVPPERAEPTVARSQYEMIAANPYRYTSDEILFAVHALRNRIGQAELEARRSDYFSRGQACLRSSPRAKRYGWGIHHDEQARVALIPRESEEYLRLSRDAALKQVKAMKSAR